MSIKIKRIQSNESGAFNSYNNGRLRAHVDVPASVGFTDLENSQLIFRMNTVVTGSETGLIRSGTLTAAGTGYANATDVALTGGSGTGAKCSIIVDGGGAIQSVEISDQGSGYEGGEVLTIPGGDGAGRFTLAAGDDGVYSVSDLLPTFVGGSASNDLADCIDNGGAAALIRNARVTSKEHGMLNERRDQNVVSANLDYYTKYSSQAEVWHSFNGGGSLQSHNMNQYSPIQDSMFLDARRPQSLGVRILQSVDTEKSQSVAAETRIPMRHIDSMADGTRQFPNLAIGDLTYRMEFEPASGRKVTGCANNDDQFACEDYTNGTGGAVSFGDSAANPDVTKVPIKYRYIKGEIEGNVEADDLEFCPFYLGMPVQVSYEHGGDTYVRVSHITGLKAESGFFEVELENPIDVPDGRALTNIEIKLRVGGQVEVEWNIEDIFLELHCLQLSPQQLQAAQSAMESLSIPYMDYRLVKKVLNQTGDYSEMIQTDAGCAGLAVLTPQNNGIASSIDNARRYRFAIEGKYTTNRDIQIAPLINNEGQSLGRQLHNHMLQKFYGNIGKKLLRFDSPIRNYNAAALDDALEEETHTFYPLVTPIVGNDSIINFQLQAESGQQMATKEIFFVAMYPRSLDFKNGRLVM